MREVAKSKILTEGVLQLHILLPQSRYRSTAHYSPTGSDSASASQRCPPDTRTLKEGANYKSASQTLHFAFCVLHFAFCSTNSNYLENQKPFYQQIFSKFLLTRLDKCDRIRVPRKRGLYFCAHFYRGRYTQLLADFSSNTLTEVPKNESKNHISLYRVQTAQLQHKEKQEEHSRQNRDEQVLQILQETHSS